jgi:hypothetical protein
MRKLAFVGVIVAVLATAATGQEAVEIKVYQPKVGDRLKVMIEEKTETKTYERMPFKKGETPTTKARSFVYVDEILACADDSPRATKLKRTYMKAVLTQGDKSTTLPVEGHTVLIEIKDGKYRFTLEEKPLEGEADRLLDAEFNTPDKKDLRPLILPAKPIKPGDTWKLDADRSFAGLNADKSISGLNGARLKFDKTHLEATGKLVKTHKVGGAQFGEFELKVVAPVFHDPTRLRQSISGDRSVTLTGDLCVDGTSPQGQTKMVRKTAFSWTSVDTGIEVDSTFTETRTTERVKP